ncbi:hypothetical protein SynBMKMC1_02293 [Synechococcus sp. BMK-MC-1]|nr:hypothetical protein SynBMKMC1_02293 [Synechococcus sp. BMK-MC-1]
MSYLHFVVHPEIKHCTLNASRLLRWSRHDLPQVSGAQAACRLIHC